jgi:hypothetical protein
MRVVRAGLLFVLGLAFALASWGPLQNLFSDYQDSPTWVYLEYGLPLLALGVGCMVAGVLSLRRR